MSKDFGVIFDMDGVIVDSNPAHKKNLLDFCNHYNHEVTEKQIRERIYGRMSREWIPEIFGDISEEEVHELVQEKGEMYREKFKPRESTIPGVLDFMKELHTEGLNIVLATSAHKENVEFILSELAIESYFDAVLHADHVEQGKPEPEIYLKAARAISYDPGNCIIFEDSIAGVEAGKRAGGKVIGVTSTHSPEEMGECDLVIDDFTDLSIRTLERVCQNKEVNLKA